MMDKMYKKNGEYRISYNKRSFSADTIEEIVRKVCQYERKRKQKNAKANT